MMKKLVSVLLMLALVCASAAAMAAEIPNKLTGNEEIGYDLRLGRGSSRIITSGQGSKGSFRAEYYFSGALAKYTYTFDDCGCEIDYNPYGEVMDSPIRRKIQYQTHKWDAEQQAWFSMKDGSEYTGDTHTPDEHLIKGPVAYAGTAGTRPPLEAVKESSYDSYTELKQAAMTTFAKNLSDETGSVKIAQGETRSDDVKYDMALVKENGMYALYANGEFVETYVGSLVFNTYWESGDECWLGGDADYGINTEGFYNWETGELEEYKFYTADRSMNAMYSLKNVLRSYETWDDKGAWWGYFDNEWYYAANGDPNDEENTIKKDPPAEILEKILHAPAPATYESACVTSESQLKEDQKGVPFILASASDINNATVKTTAEQTGARSTEFDISLLNASGKEVELAADSVTLTLGYPAGMPQDVSKNYEFAVVHTLDDGTEEVMTTMTNNVKLTANGPQVTATGFSPYTVIWGTADELAEYAKKASAGKASTSLPQTGDDSMLLVWAALLAVSCTALVMKKRSRA